MRTIIPRPITILAALVLATPAAAEPSLRDKAAREAAQETFASMRPRLEAEIRGKLHNTWSDVDLDFRAFKGEAEATLSSTRVTARLEDAYPKSRQPRAIRALRWDWRAGEGRVRIQHGKHDAVTLNAAHIRPGSQLLVTHTERPGGGITLEAVRVTRRQGRVSPELARELAAWCVPWRRGTLSGELPRGVRRALARPGAAFTIFTCQTRTSLQPQPSLAPSCRPPASVRRQVERRIIVGSMNAPLSEAAARALRGRAR